jgi:hypothetical protein
MQCHPSIYRQAVSSVRPPTLKPQTLNPPQPASTVGLASLTAQKKPHPHGKPTEPPDQGKPSDIDVPASTLRRRVPPNPRLKGFPS